MGDHRDPGWAGAARGLAWVLVPGLAVRRARAAAPALQALRMLFVSFTAALALVGVVVAIMEAFGDVSTTVPGGAVLPVVAGVGALSLVADRRFAPPLDGTSPAALVESYTRRAFVRIAIADTPALVGFAGFVLSGDPRSYVVGLAFAAVGFARLAPTARHLEADQRELAATGCTRSLVEVLTGGPRR